MKYVAQNEKKNYMGFHISGPVSECNCLPACNDMKFPSYTTTSKLNKASLIKTSNALKTKVPGIKNDSYVKENIAILHIYHEELHFLKHERGQVYLHVHSTYLPCLINYLV